MLLSEAVDAYHAALKETSREVVPLEWAATQSNLALGLASIGARESGIVRLEEAVAACRSVLTVFTTKTAPQIHEQVQRQFAYIEAEIERRRV